jgi:lipopolysaccharide export system protein LptC
MSRAWNLLRNAVDRATIYLPIILTAAVALGTYWLVRNAPKLLEPTVKAAPTHEPDYFMRGFVINQTFVRLEVLVRRPT